MHNSGDIPQQCQKNIQPKMLAQTDLQEDPKRRQQNRSDDADQIHAEILRWLRHDSPTRDDIACRSMNLSHSGVLHVRCHPYRRRETPAWRSRAASQNCTALLTISSERIWHQCGMKLCSAPAYRQEMRT